MELAVYFDFTCAYSYRAWLWFERMSSDGANLRLDWRPFVLKEVNRNEGAPSLLTGPKITSVAVLALAVGEALTDKSAAESYRAKMFHSMHAGSDRPSREEILRTAIEFGLNHDAFRDDEAGWLGTVRESHQEAVTTLGVFGTPTLVAENSGAMYVKLENLPRADDHHLFRAIVSLTTDHPEVAELKRPTRSE